MAELNRLKKVEVENMIMNKKMTFDDIEKLNYRQINEVSTKFGEDEFDPTEILDLKDDSDHSEQEEILKIYRAKSLYKPPHKTQDTRHENPGRQRKLQSKPSMLWNIVDPDVKPPLMVNLPNP